MHVKSTRQKETPTPSFPSRRLDFGKRPNYDAEIMPPNDKIEQSLGHLPDLSDASVSFQIPADSSSAEFLLADNSGDLEFLRGAGATSFATIAPTPGRGRLKLSDVTRKVESRLLPPRSPSPGPSTHHKNDPKPSRFRHQSPVKAKKTPRAAFRLKEIALDEPIISEERLESLRAEVETLKDDYITMHVEPSTVAQCSVIPMLHNTATTRPTVKPRSITANPTIEGGRNAKPASRSKIPVSADGKLPTAKPTMQSSPTWSSVAESSPIDAESHVPPAEMTDDIIMTSDISQDVRLTPEGMAERLMSYSQKLMSSIGIYKPKTENSFTTDTGEVVAKTEGDAETQPSPAVRIVHTPFSLAARSGNDHPLRLSDISPQKREAETSASSGHLFMGRRELSPMRPATKRPATEEDPPSHQHGGNKKGKSLSQNVETKASPSISGPSTQALKSSTEKNRAHASAPIGRDSRWPTSNFPSARTKYKPKFNSHRKGPSGSTVPRSSTSCGIKTISKEKGKCVEGRSAASTSRSLPPQSRVSGTSRVQFHEDKVGEKKPILFERLGPSRAGLVSSLEKTGITLPPANLTKPVAFTFRVDARIEARKDEKFAVSEQGRSHRQRHAIPDFKALHEAHEASLAGRRHIVPIVWPPSVMLNTEIRARDRDKFDEMVRMKEADIERAKEECRRQQEAEEEREIRELRRRAVPKANEIPDWYADMPKRGGDVRGPG